MRKLNVLSTEHCSVPTLPRSQAGYSQPKPDHGSFADHAMY